MADAAHQELAEVCRRMDAIVAKAAAQGALDEQFTQLRELEVRKIEERRREERRKKRARSKERARRSSKKFNLLLSKKKNQQNRTTPTRTLSPRSPRSTSPTPPRSSTSSPPLSRRYSRGTIRICSLGPRSSMRPSTSSRAPRRRSAPLASRRPASASGPLRSLATWVPSATCCKTASGASSRR